MPHGERRCGPRRASTSARTIGVARRGRTCRRARRPPRPRRATRARAASSAFTTAVPPRGSAAIASACSRATSATRAHELLVLALRVGDERDGRRDDAGELARLAAMVHAELEHREAMVRRAAAARASGTPIALLRLPGVAAHVRRHRRARAGSTRPSPSSSSCRCCRRPRRRAARSGGASARRARRAPRACRRPRCAAPRSHRRARRSTSAATAPRASASPTKSWPSKRSPFSATKRSPAATVRVSVDTRVNVTRRSERAAAATAAAAACVSIMRRAAGDERAARDRDVGERQAPARDLLVRLVALAGDQHDVAGLAHRRARAGSPPRGRARRDSAGCPPRGCLRRSPARSPAASSLRGLSLVTTTRSASVAAMRPISGRLPVSRSPPQPNTHGERAPAAHRRAQRGERLLERVGRVRVVDDDERRVVAAEPLHAARPAARGRAAPRARRRTARRSRAARRARRAGSCALNAPTSARLDVAAAPRRRHRQHERRARRSRCRSTRCRRRAEPYVIVRTPRRRTSSARLRPNAIVDVDDGALRGPATRRAAPSPRRTRPSCRGSRGGRATGW